MSLPSFPFALQAQIVRANQRDLFHVSSLREQTEAGLRPWLGTRWLTRRDKELDLLTKLLYFGLTTGRATQTLGEEYTDVWQHSAINGRPPSRSLRAMLVLLSTLPTYALTRWGAGMPERWRMIPTVLSVFAEVNLAVFYLNGAYYDLAKRLLGVRYISSIPQDPRTRPPSYALLGILLAIRLLHRLITHIRSSQVSRLENSKKPDYRARETYIDDRPVSTFLGPVDPEGEPAKPAEEDEGTILDMSSIPPAQRAGRNCTLCLEERVDSCATECGHLFCWSCIVGWGREKAECPLCRQSLSLTRLLPIYNL